MTQKILILDYLRKGNTLTTHSAITKLGIYSLAKRVSELNEHLPIIQKRKIHTRTGKTLTQYYIPRDNLFLYQF